jgi:glutamyl-tRNA reductase
MRYFGGFIDFHRTGDPKMAKKKTSSAKESLIVASKVKNYVRSKKMMTSTDAIGALSDKIYSLLDQAMDRCKNNKRSTLKPHDL